jgi:hypothetical protein
MLRRLTVFVSLVGVIAVVVREIAPDIARYLKLREM